MRPFLLALAPLVLSAPSVAQMHGGEWNELYSFSGIFNGDLIGWQTTWIGDLDNDGVDDLIAGAPGATVGANVRAGCVAVFSGASGTLIRQTLGFAADEQMGWSVAAMGDVNGDGVPEYAAGAPTADVSPWIDAGVVYVFNGSTGAILRRFDGQASFDNFGISVASLGDINNDNRDDIVIGASTTDPGGRLDAGSAYVYSTLTSSLIRQIDGANAGDMFGSAVAGVGDLDGDGTPDMVVGAPAADPGGLNDAGCAYAHSGASGNQLFQVDGLAAGDSFGATVSAAGDADADGTPDVAMGAPARTVSGTANSGTVYVVSGSGGSTIHTIDAPELGGGFGSALSPCGDLDDDSHDDLVIGAPKVDTPGRVDAGAAYVFSGEDASLMANFYGNSANDEFGTAVAGNGDGNSDGVPDLFLGAPYDDVGFTDNGTAYAHALDPYLRLDGRELSVAGGANKTFTIDFPNSKGGMNYALLASGAGRGPTTLAGIPVPLSQDFLLNKLLTGWTPPVLLNHLGTLNGAGDASATLVNAPVLGNYVGSTVYWAAVAYQPGGGAQSASSIARTMEIVP